MTAHRSGSIRLGVLRGIVVLVGACCLARNARADEPLHVRIDALVTGGNASLAAASCSDGEFLRRVYLDLAGTIPSAAETRAFLDDKSPEKRIACIERLLAGPRFARQMAQSFDTMLMERRPQKHVEVAKWQSYLYEAFASDKPLDQLFNELLAADGVDPAQRAAARFVLDRDAEPNLLTRDVGRIVFGHDLQCAQCHDHPTIDDYYQRDYYELMAFFNRTKLFTEPNKPVVLADDPHGEVSYQSVFDKSAKGTVHPRVPGGKQVEEPKLAANETWVVAPAANVRPVPKFSRRAQLPGEAMQCRQFARNLANRLWAMLLGRGIVEPVDLHHLNNPPVHPQLLELLTDELIARKYSAKSLLREIALSQSYQRSSELPKDLVPLAGTAAAQIPVLSQECERLKQAVAASTDGLAKVATALTEAQKPMPPLMEELDKTNAALAAARKAAEDAGKPVADLQGKIANAQSAAQLIAEALAKAKQAVEKLPENKELAAAAEVTKVSHDKLVAEQTAMTEQLTKLQAAATAAAEGASAATRAVEESAKKLDEARSQIAALEPQHDAATTRAAFDTALVKSTENRIAAAKALADLAAAANDPSKVTQVRGEIADRWSRQWLLGSIRPLTPEQFSWCLMKAVGLVDLEMAASAAEVDRQSPPSEVTYGDGNLRTRRVEQTLTAKMTNHVNRFVSLYGAGSGQPQHEFFATVDQALFLANGPEVKSWLAPNGENLTARLIKIDDTAKLAEELYLSVFTRRPVESEVAAVAEYLKARGVDKPEKKAEKTAAVQELAWGLLASVEFRFIH
jgi:hypothetical protein